MSVSSWNDAPPRPPDEVLAWSRALLDPALRAAVDDMPPATRAVAAFHFGWRDAEGRPAAGDAGKAVRPALALLSAAAVGGTAAAALPAAVAVELAHNFSLLHDDVMDGDVIRRHRPTAWTVFGANAAILAGDGLLAGAFEALAGGPSPASSVRTLGRAVLALVEGQSEDLSFERRTEVSLAECLAMAGRKTGALLGASCVLGAAHGGADGPRAERLGAFGERVGLAFQLADDLLGIWGDPETTGKPVHSDLRNRKQSLPVVAALASGTPAGDRLGEIYRRGAPLDDAAAARAADLVEEAGARAWAAREADALRTAALADLDAAEPVPAAAGELRALARLLTHRDR
ncbi:family 2 encapsulin nanocompartment cargo protein polyprenyl transferase [Actinomadura sp. LOL_016]|uniref:family 2 encapsulin nanocompartment cargo protein polyprenyl transferase n=1 Tax=unclassified Actinomadura TaxID=2626254 RepID=UPI003A8092DE